MNANMKCHAKWADAAQTDEKQKDIPTGMCCSQCPLQFDMDGCRSWTMQRAAVLLLKPEAKGTVITCLHLALEFPFEEFQKPVDVGACHIVEVNHRGMEEHVGIMDGTYV